LPPGVDLVTLARTTCITVDHPAPGLWCHGRVMTTTTPTRTLRTLLGLAVLVSLFAGAAEAHAAEPSLENIVRGTWNRARRSVAFGPTVGIGGLYATSAEELDAPISFGLAFEMFKVNVLPDAELVKEMIIERSKVKLETRVKQMALEGKPAPTQAELEQMALEVFEETKAEILGEMSYRPKSFEKPRFFVNVESAYLPSADVWEVRFTPAIGIGPISIGPTLAVGFADETGAFLGGEAAVHFMPTKSPRSPVVEVYLRADFGVTDATEEASSIGLGARFVLDLI
jgi:hypothetical protein